MFCNTFRVGRDAEVRYTQNGDAVCGLALAYDFGYAKNKGTQWVDAVLFGKTAEALAPYLTKGKQIYAVLDDVRNEEYEGKTRMKARVVKITLVGNKSDREEEQAAKPRAKAQPAAQPVADIPEDDVPF